MKIKTFKKQLSIKDIRLKSYKIMKKLNTIEDEEPINIENIDEMNSKSLLIKLLKSIKLSGNDFIEKDEDLLKAANLLFKIPSLQKFYKEYSINVKSLKEMLSFIEIKYLYKGNSLFNQYEIPNEMFILLDGQLSLKYNKNIKQESTLEPYVINEFNLDYFHYKNFNNICENMDKTIHRKNFRKPISKNINFNIENDNFSNDSNLQNEEIEYLIINDERFISQNNLLTLTPHSINCYVSSNECLVLVLDKKSFNVSIQKNFMRYDLEYKKFICSRMNVFEKFHNETLNIYFYSWIKIYPKTHEKIFSINDEAKYFYLLYNGECINIISNRNINIFSKGSFIGLDCLFNPNKKYTSTVICKDDNTILFKFNPLSFNEKILNELKTELNQFYEIKQQTSNDFILKKENMENKFKHNYFHLTKDYIQDKLKQNEDRLDLLERNPFNMNILIEEKERDKEKISVNNKKHNKVFISLNKIKNSILIKKNKTQTNTEVNLIKYTNSINKNIPKISLKKRDVLNLESLNSSSSLIKNRTFSKRKYNKKKIIKKFPKTNYSRLFLGKQLISSRNINRKNSPLSILKLSEDLELTLYSSYADPINKKSSFFENQSICNDVDLLTLSDKRYHPNFFSNNNNNRNKKTLIQKVELSCDKWKKTLNDSKKVFTTKHYKLPLISSINE